MLPSAPSKIELTLGSLEPGLTSVLSSLLLSPHTLLGTTKVSPVTHHFLPALTQPQPSKPASQMLRGEVETDAIWTCNLNELDDVTGWNFVENEESGAFSIEKANLV